MEAVLVNRFDDIELFSMFNVEGQTKNGVKFDLWEVSRKRTRLNPKAVARDTALNEAHNNRVRKLRAEVYRMSQEFWGMEDDE